MEIVGQINQLDYDSVYIRHTTLKSIWGLDGP